jgi:SET domain-containing protein
MFVIKTYIDKSSIDGIGVFTSVKISKGQVVWRFVPGLDRIITKNKIDKLPKIYQDHIRKCGFLPKDSKNYLLSIDNDIYSNHSPKHNLIEDTTKAYKVTPSLVARRDIKIGEELTQNYFEYDNKDDADYKLSHYNS